LSLYTNPTLLEEKVLSALRIWDPLKVLNTLKKVFLWVLYRTLLGFRTWPIETFTKKKWFYIEPFWSSIYEAGDGTISGSK